MSLTGIHDCRVQDCFGREISCLISFIVAEMSFYFVIFLIQRRFRRVAESVFRGCSSMSRYATLPKLVFLNLF